MSKKETTGQGIMRMISVMTAMLTINCIFMPSEVNADFIDDFIAETCKTDGIDERIKEDFKFFWNNESMSMDRQTLHDQVRSEIVAGLNEMLRGRNLDPGQRYIWRCNGVGGFTLGNYPGGPNFPTLTVNRVRYHREYRVRGTSWPFLIFPVGVFTVDWSASWDGERRSGHNGPYIYFRITGGYAWHRGNDVRVTIEDIDMNAEGQTTFTLYGDGTRTVSSETEIIHPASETLEAHPDTINDVVTINGEDGIDYYNPNNYGWKRRCGNRIINEIRRNYEDRIKKLLYEHLFENFITSRLRLANTENTENWECGNCTDGCNHCGCWRDASTFWDDQFNWVFTSEGNSFDEWVRSE